MVSDSSVKDVLSLIADVSRATKDYSDMVNGTVKFHCPSLCGRMVYSNTNFSVYLFHSIDEDSDAEYSISENNTFDDYHYETEYLIVVRGSIRLKIEGRPPIVLSAPASTIIPSETKHSLEAASEGVEGCSVMVSD